MSAAKHPSYALGTACLAVSLYLTAPLQAARLTCTATGEDATATCDAGTDGYSALAPNGGESGWVIQESVSRAVQGAAAGSSLFLTPVPTGTGATIDADGWTGTPPNGERWSLEPREIRFTMTANNTRDDNFIGFASIDQGGPFLLYDWRRSNSNPAPVGSRLTLIAGNAVDYFPMTGSDATSLGRGRSHGDNPWSENHVNEVTIAFSETHLSIRVYVAGTLITGEEFEIALADLPEGTLDGNLAFYTRSQSNVAFTLPSFTAAFRAIQNTPAGTQSTRVNAPGGLAGLGLVCLGLAVMVRRGKPAQHHERRLPPS